MTYYYSILNIGYRLGNLARDIELVIETLNSKESKLKFHLELYRVQETLKYINDELVAIQVMESIQSDIQSYLIQLTGFDANNEEKDERTTILKKIKKGVTERKYRANRELNSTEIRELDLKVKGWKDKLIGELAKIS